MKTVTTRFRQSPEERAELEELREWLDEGDLSAVLRRAVEELKEESGFNLRDVEPMEPGEAQKLLNKHLAAHAELAVRDIEPKVEPRPAVPAFVPGFRPPREDE